MKQKIKSFADRAREIKNRYKRADYDEIEQNELKAELRKLRDEQEQFRIDSGIAEDEESEEYKCGGKYDGGGIYVSGNRPVAEVKNQIPTMRYDLAGDLNTTTPKDGFTYQTPQSSILPTLISAGTSLAGNIIGANRADKLSRQSVVLPRTTAEQINLEPERQALTRKYNTASNVMLRNARDMSSPGAAYANQITGITSLTDSLGSGLSQSYMNEANTNAQYRTQANTMNAEIGAKEALTNMDLKNTYLNQANQYRDAAISTIPAALRDYREQVNQDNLISTFGRDYGLYSKIPINETFTEKLKRNILGNRYNMYNRQFVNESNQ